MPSDVARGSRTGWMREGLQVLALVLGLSAAVFGCLEEERDVSGRVSGGPATKERAGEGTSEIGGTAVEDDLGHQAYQPATRLVVPAAEGDPLDRVARVAAGLSESALGTTIFVDQLPGKGGLLAWRDVADEEPDGHQLAYVTEELLVLDGSGASGVGPDDFEMVAQVDSGAAVLCVKKDPEAESFQDNLADLADFVVAAKEHPEWVEVADPGPDTIYRAGTLALEREAGIDLTPRFPGKKPPTGALYDGDVEAVLLPAEEVLTDVWAGELRAVAVFGEARSADLPNVPTAKELGYDVSVPVWGGIAVPAGTPPRVVEELGRTFVAASSSRVFRVALRGTGREPTQRGPEEFADYVEEQSRLLSEDNLKSGGDE
jgi:tripartite-type tricarboxylate transporter receptor subunit TctC